MDLKPTNPKDRLATNRLDLSLFPDTAVAYGSLGMTEGDSKYGGYNYRVGGVLVSIYVAAARRHISRFFNGQWADPKTHVPHLASALACIAIIIDAHECGVLKDDRPPKCNISRFLEEAEEIVEHLHTIFRNGPSRYTEIINGRKVPEKKKLPKVPKKGASIKTRHRRRPASKRRRMR